MCKLTSNTQLATFLFVDSQWHEPHDAVQCHARGSTFKFLFKFQTEFFVRVSSCLSIKPFDYRGSTVYLKPVTTHMLLAFCYIAPWKDMVVTYHSEIVNNKQFLNPNYLKTFYMKIYLLVCKANSWYLQKTFFLVYNCWAFMIIRYNEIYSSIFNADRLRVTSDLI
jgi:hypothetical protein